jgi:hypothetical protein
MFLRFVVGSESDNAFLLDGVFTVANNGLLDAGKLDRHEKVVLRSAFDWFNENVPVPPYKEKLRHAEWSTDAVSWFRDEAQEAILRLRDVVALLEEHGIRVRMFRTDDPGRIVYSDRYQIVAETPWWAFRGKRPPR